MTMYLASKVSIGVLTCAIINVPTAAIVTRTNAVHTATKDVQEPINPTESALSLSRSAATQAIMKLIKAITYNINVKHVGSLS